MKCKYIVVKRVMLITYNINNSDEYTEVLNRHVVKYVEYSKCITKKAENKIEFICYLRSQLKIICVYVSILY